MNGLDVDTNFSDEFVHLARLALAGRSQDVQLHIRRVTKRCRASTPEVADALSQLLRQAPTRSSPLRKTVDRPLPVDLDSRLHLIRPEFVTSLDVEPVFEDHVKQSLDQLVRERRERDRLDTLGLSPTRTVLLTGPPGVGKSLSARWLARELHVPLLVLDLSAVMSSFLGRTGSNLRHVLDYAKTSDCILLVDELDAVAKRRDDAAEVGELKRLVNVLLQEIDDWPPDNLLVAATNHPALLDPAVWRRFEMTIEFPMPSPHAIRDAVARFSANACDPDWQEILSLALKGASFSDVERTVLAARREAAIAVNGGSTPFERAIRNRAVHLSAEDRKSLAITLVDSLGVSQRRAYDLTGVSRDTIRRHIRDEARA